MDEAITIEIDIFADLIKRPEPSNMIQTLFLGKQAYNKRKKAGALPEKLAPFIAAVRAAVAASTSVPEGNPALRFAGFGGGAAPVSFSPSSAADVAAKGLSWIASPQSDIESAARRVVAAAGAAAADFQAAFSEDDRRLADYAAVREAGFPAYLGGPFTVLRDLGAERCRELAGS